MIKLHKGDRGRDKWKEFFHSRSLLSVLMLTLTFAIILGVLMIVATPKRHDLKVGDIAGTTITATKDIEDAIATEKLRQAAAASIVEGMTKLDTTISQSVDDQVLGLLTSMMELREEYRAASIVITPTPPPTPTPSPETEAHEAQETQAETAEPTATLDLTPSDNTADLIAANQQKVIADAEDKLSELKLTTDQIAALLTAEESTFDSFCDVMLTLTRETMEEGVRDGQLSSRLQTLHLQILGRGVSGELLQVGYAMVDQCVKENVFIDEDATQEERQKAADAVEPVMYKKGQNIVQAGEVVTAQQLALRRFGQTGAEEFFQPGDGFAHVHHRVGQPRRVAENGIQHEASQHSPGGHHTPASASFVYCTVFTRRSWRFSAQSAASST